MENINAFSTRTALSENKIKDFSVFVSFAGIKPMIFRISIQDHCVTKKTRVRLNEFMNDKIMRDGSETISLEEKKYDR